MSQMWTVSSLLSDTGFLLFKVHTAKCSTQRHIHICVSKTQAWLYDTHFISFNTG